MHRWLVVLSLIGILGVGCAQPSDSFRTKQHVVRFGTTPPTVIKVWLADSPSEQALGLGDHPPLVPGEGMAFQFDHSAEQTFWMKDTEFPIDIVWVQHGVVMGVAANVQPEAPTTPLAAYREYRSGTPVNMVVELPAGYAAANNIDTGLSAILDEL